MATTFKVVSICSGYIQFTNEVQLYSYHEKECCEEHYLSFTDLTMLDFEGLKFDFSNDYFFKRIPGYGIELIPVFGHSIKIPGYSSNNGYYIDALDLVISNSFFTKKYDISECQPDY